jgi:uncharacterized protein (TIGR02996 family)
MNDLAALYAACREVPADDYRRLALADCLQEQEPVYVPCPAGCVRHERANVFVKYMKPGGHMLNDTTWFRCETCDGSGEVRVNLNAVRAELIRAQVRLSRPPWDSRDMLREQAILRDHAAVLLPPCPCCGGPDSPTSGCVFCGDARLVGTYSRGLLSVPVPTLGTVLVRERVKCPDCGGAPEWENEYGFTCATCRDEGTAECDDHILTPYAADLLARHPNLERVEVGDREPEEHRSVGQGTVNYSWYAEGFADDRATIPLFIHERLRGGQEGLSALRRAYDTADLARDALARAVCEGMWSLLSPSPVAAGV